jgi:hypothetical protein
VVKSDDDATGSYEQTWTITTDYILEPLNGIENGRTGFPYWRIRAVGTDRRFLSGQGRPQVQVTAQWGWAAVPASVKQANKILAAQYFTLKDAPHGIAGVNDFGPLRVQDVPQAARLLSPYQHPARTVAVG